MQTDGHFVPSDIILKKKFAKDTTGKIRSAHAGSIPNIAQNATQRRHYSSFHTHFGSK